MKIVYTDQNTAEKVDIEDFAKYTPEGMDVEWKAVFFEEDGADKFWQEVESADAIINNYFEWGKEQIDHLDPEKCKVLASNMTGFNLIDVDYAAEKGIPVTNINEYCTDEVSYHAIALMLALQRGLHVFSNSVQNDHLWKWDVYTGQQAIRDQTLGVIGFGKIGQYVAKKAMALGMKCIAYDPYVPKEVAEKMGVTLYDNLDDVLENSDVITLHMALTDETKGLIGKEEFAKMKKHPFIINCARGPLIDEAALVEALDKGEIKGAGLDVLESEYPDIDTCPLVNRDDVILTPHVAFYSDASNERIYKIGAANVFACLTGNYKDANRIVNGVHVD